MDTAEIASLLARVAQTITAEDLWREMLQEDPVYRKIPDALRCEAVARAAAFGQQASRAATERCGISDPAVLADKVGATVVYSQDPHVFGKVVRTSTYTARTKTITLFAGAIEEMDRILAGAVGEALGVHAVGPVYLAHELFHHLEESELGRAADRLQVTTLKLGPLVLRSGIGQMSEIAADAFAQALLGLRPAPRVLDYLTIWIHNPEVGRRRLTALARD